jgi:membrane-associated phospholipid phosphatase
MPTSSSLIPFNVLRTPARIATALIALALFNACTSDKSGPTALNAPVNVSSNDVHSPQALLSPVWQQTARDYVSTARFSPLAAGHAYPLLGVAQYLAVQRAEDAIDGGGRVRLETDRGAVAGASVTVLSYLFFSRTQELEALVTAQRNAGPGGPHPAFAAGEAIGRAIGAEIVARARTDGFTAQNNAITPVGQDWYWISSTTPPTLTAGGQLPGVTPWFLTSANQFRPGPPPAFLSTRFRDALAEVRVMVDTGNAAMKEIARSWALNAGTFTAAGYWLDLASTEIVRRGLSERKATHIFALASATMFDAAIGCWDAKLTYWLIRPWNADINIHPLASMGTPPPNHPSYPSGHSCVSSSGAAVLSAFFPDKSAELNALVIEAGMSRIYGGIHYRFDCETGQVLGRGVAALAIAADASGNSVLTPNEGQVGEH